MFKHKKIYQTLEDLYDDYKKLVYVFISDYVESEDVKDELVQIFWTKVYKHFDFLRNKEEGRLKSYLRVMAKNVCMDFYRKEAREDTLLEDYGQVNEDGLEKSAENVFFDEDDLTYLRQAWKILSEEEQEMLTFKYGYQMMNIEIAKLYDISEGLTAVRLQRIRRKLKKEMMRIKEAEEGGGQVE